MPRSKVPFAGTKVPVLGTKVPVQGTKVSWQKDKCFNLYCSINSVEQQLILKKTTEGQKCQGQKCHLQGQKSRFQGQKCRFQGQKCPYNSNKRDCYMLLW